MMQIDDKVLRSARDASAKVVAAADALRDKYTALVRERDEVEKALPPLEVVLANKDRLVDEAARQYALTAAQILSGSRDGRVAPQLPYARLDGLTLQDLCVLAGPMVKVGLGELIRMSGASFGLAPEARQRRLVELDAQISDIEQQHTELVDGAVEAGLTLPLLDTVRERREQERQNTTRNDALAAERARVDGMMAAIR